MFQSTPDIAVGRNACSRQARTTAKMFQSTPDIAVGRNNLRMMATRGLEGFNPRPTSLSGETTLYKKVGRRYVVSIHARHRCRAKLKRMREQRMQWVFQSTPDIAVGRNALKAIGLNAEDLFQSTPDIAVGRNFSPTP